MAYGQGDRQRSSSPPRRQRACLPCSRAKAKCDFPDGAEDDPASTCFRCRRMRIDCLPQTTKVLRRPRLKTSTRVSSFDKKRDSVSSTALAGSHSSRSLVDYSLSSYDNSSPEATPPTVSSSENAGPGGGHGGGHEGGRSFLQPSVFGQYLQSNQPIPDPYPAAYLHDSNTTTTAAIPSEYDSPRLDYSGSAPGSPGFGLTWKQAEQAVASFKLNYMPNFPFVAIGPHILAHQLYCEKPLVFRTVMLVAATFSRARQREIRRSINAYLGQHMLVHEERSLDLLQGLLIFLAWGNHDFDQDRHTTMMLHLAVGYAHNLGITRAQSSNTTEAPEALVPGHPDMGPASSFATTYWRALEEKRAFLGVYYMLSANSTHFRRPNALRTPYVEYCLEYLGRSAQFWTDSNLEKMVRLLQIVEAVSDTFPVVKDPDRVKSYSYLLSGEIKPLREQVDKIFESFTRDQFACFSHYNFVLVRLYEPAIWLSSPPGEDSFYRCQCLLYCLQSAKSFYNNLLALGAEGHAVRTYVCAAEALSVLVTACRILFLDVEGWDLEAARQMFDFPAVAQQLANAFASVSVFRKRRAMDEMDEMDDKTDDESDDVHLQNIMKLMSIKSWFENRVAAESAGLPPMEAEPFMPDMWHTDESAGNTFFLGFPGSQSFDFEF